MNLIGVPLAEPTTESCTNVGFNVNQIALEEAKINKNEETKKLQSVLPYAWGTTWKDGWVTTQEGKKQ